MTGNHLQFAKEALLVFLKNLPANCLFNIVSFGTSYASLFPGFVCNGKTLKQCN
ncbi:hypothetical protein DPMN_027134 [Dreissena polymorpha]|uniref:VWFA domain-containing protein n=1 Tax=Dreissena polymorpha TaxID=45954 RepID=A0A9D4RF82_DREPO|nr:hypothetical protein DPMN_027134 [Dreissena polymorpha]